MMTLVSNTVRVPPCDDTGIKHRESPISFFFITFLPTALVLFCVAPINGKEEEGRMPTSLMILSPPNNMFSRSPLFN